MTNNTQLVSVPRELLKNFIEYSVPVAEDARWFADKQALRALLAAPAEDVRAVVEEPVGYALDSMLKRIKDNPSSGHMIFGSPNGGYDIPLYRHPQRPVVLPERFDIPHRDEYESADHYAAAVHEANTWNACMDAVEELNK